MPDPLAVISSDSSDSLVEPLHGTTGTPRSTTRQASIIYSTGFKSGLRPEIAPRDPHVRSVRCPTSHFADLQLIHGPCAKI
jgi:hypothetical protein